MSSFSKNTFVLAFLQELYYNTFFSFDAVAVKVAQNLILKI